MLTASIYARVWEKPNQDELIHLLEAFYRDSAMTRSKVPGHLGYVVGTERRLVDVAPPHTMSNYFEDWCAFRD